MSPSSRRVDMLIKLNRYMRAGVKEYWIVDPEKKTVLVYDFVNNDFAHTYSFDDEIPVAPVGIPLIGLLWLVCVATFIAPDLRLSELLLCL